jgi:hypothetical protein
MQTRQVREELARTTTAKAQGSTGKTAVRLDRGDDVPQSSYSACFLGIRTDIPGLRRGG